MDFSVFVPLRGGPSFPQRPPPEEVGLSLEQKVLLFLLLLRLLLTCLVASSYLHYTPSFLAPVAARNSPF